MRYDLKLTPETTLERHCAKWLREQARDYADDDGKPGSIAGVMKDLSYGGCQSGMVGHLIYYTDTGAFYRRNASEIDRMLADMCDDAGSSISGLFGDKWDNADPMARERDGLNQNLLAWFGFEEACRTLTMRAGWEG